MRPREKAGGKAPKTQRPKTLKRRNTPDSVVPDEVTNVARLTRERDEALEQLAATADVLKVISSSPGELEPVFNAMLENATRICDASYGVMFLCEGKGFRTAAMHNLPRAFAEERQRAALIEPIPIDPLAQLAKTKQRVHIADARTEAAYKRRFAPFVAAVEDGGVRTLLLTPLLREDQLIGAFAIFRQEVRPFTGKQIALVDNFAAQAVIAIENTRLLNELRQRTDDLSEALEQQTATSEVLKVISSSTGELHPVFQAMLENAVRICEAKFGVLFLYKDGKIRQAAMLNVPTAHADSLRQRDWFVPEPGVPLDRVLKTKKLIHTLDEAASANPAPSARLAGARSHIAVPMVKDDELVGAIVIYRQEVRPFTDKQIELVKNFAAQAVIAIENTRLLNELRQRTDDLTESLEQQTVTAEILQTINRSPGDVAPVFDAMVESAMHFCQADYGHVYSYDGGFFHLIAAHGEPRYLDWIKQTGPRLPENSLTLERVINGAPFVHIADIAEDDTYRSGNPRARTIVDKFDIHTLLTVALRKEDKLLGSFVLYRRVARPFSEKQVALVQNFATQAVIAMENARLLTELRQRTNDLSESLQQQTATADVLKVISRSAFDLQPIFETVAESAVRLCGADKAIILRFDGELLHTVVAHNASPELAEFMRQNPIRPGRGTTAGRAALERRTTQIADVMADPEYTYGSKAIDPLRTVLAVPMVRGDELLGVILTYRLEVKPFSEKQIALVETFADQAVIAIANVRLFDEVQARTRELAKSLDDLRTTQDRLVQTQKLASLGQLTAGIAHEIKNPLNFVNNFSGLSSELIDELQEALGDVSLIEKRHSEITELMDTLRGNLDKVIQHGKRADAIVKNMLQHSREGSGEHNPVDINALVEECLTLAWHGARAEKQGFTITRKQSFDPSAGKVDIFPQDITRALLNLISNGFYAATKRNMATNGGDYEPTLTASTRDLGDRVEIRIRDNGTGIPPDVKEKMFNPFFTTKPTGEGTGLGLSISHDIIVKQHAGSIDVDTQPGEFTEIIVTLPRAAVFV